MYQPGSIIYFDPFHFNEGQSKPKYFLVLKVLKETVVLASLPSSQIHLPASQPLQHGCLDQPENGINCYIIEANKPITKSGWAFPLLTILYGHWLDDYEIVHLNTKYSIESVDYEIIGDLLPEELEQILNCFKNSSVVKRKYRRWLNEK